MVRRVGWVVCAQHFPTAPSAATAHRFSSPVALAGNDPFTVPQMEWEAFRDLTLTPSFGRLVLHNATHATYTQLRNADGSLLDGFTLVQAAHGPFHGF